MKLNQIEKGRTRLPWLLPLGLAFLALITWANFHYLETPKYAHRDFMSLWGGGRAILLGQDPYDPEVWRPLRLELGSKWETGDQGNPFPLWTLLLMTPLSALPLGWAAAIWLTVSQLLLAVSIYILALELGRRQPSIAEFGLVALGAFTFRGTLVTMHNGQITLFLLAAVAAFLILLKRKRPFAAGFALAFILLKPNPFILFAPVIALWLLAQRNWRAIGGGLVASGLMLTGSWLAQPGWLFAWQTVRDKTGTSIRSFIMPTLWGVATEISVDWAPLLGAALVVGLTAVVGWYLLRRQGPGPEYAVSAAIIGSLLVTPYAWAYEHALLLIPLTLLYTRIGPRWLASAIWIGLVYLLPWAMYRASEAYGRGTLEVAVPLLAAAVFVIFVCRQSSLGEPETVHEASPG